MAHPLDGARAKVRRASKHLRELNAEVRGFIDEHPYAFRLEDNPDTGLPIYRVYALGVDEQPPEWLGVIVGDIAHNLRSALDHTVCQLARLNQATCSETQFPLCFSNKSFDYEEAKRLAGLTDRHRTMIRRVQPYHRRKGGVLLAILRELSNMDKHRVVNPAARAMTFVPPTVTPANAVTRFTVEYRDKVRMEHGAEYLRFTEFTLRRGAAEVSVNLNTTFNVVFGEWGKNEISLFSLGELRDYVRTLVGRFAKEF